jgi:hypothetical protein
MKEWDGTEAEALEESITPQEHEETRLMLRQASMVDSLEQRLETVKSAKVGDTVNCPACDREMVKTTYHKTFCSNAKTHGKRNCKDRFHNVLRYHRDPGFAMRVDIALKR